MAQSDSRRSAIKPDRDRFQELAGQGNIVPVYREVLADTDTPVSAYLKLRGESDCSFLFESIEGGERAAEELVPSQPGRRRPPRRRHRGPDEKE